MAIDGFCWTSAFPVPFANILKAATSMWATVFLAAVANVAMVLLALFVLRLTRAEARWTGDGGKRGWLT